MNRSAASRVPPYRLPAFFACMGPQHGFSSKLPWGALRGAEGQREGEVYSICAWP